MSELPGMAGVTGLEPAASGVTGQRSNQLSYTPLKRRAEDVRQPVGTVKQRRALAPHYLHFAIKSAVHDYVIWWQCNLCFSIMPHFRSTRRG